MINYSLVPVDHQPNFENYSLVPVDYDPFIDDDVAQQMRSQQAQAQTLPAQIPIQAPQAQSQPQVQLPQVQQPQVQQAQLQPPRKPIQPAPEPAPPISGSDEPVFLNQQPPGQTSVPGPVSGDGGPSFGQQVLQGSIEAIVPGAYNGRQGYEQFRQGNYGVAAGYEAAALAESVLAILTLGASARLGTLAPVTRTALPPNVGPLTHNVHAKLETYLLDPNHVKGGPKAKWFQEALGFNEKNLKDLEKQFVFDESQAVQTVVTEHGTKFNQIINVTGANGRTIPVTTAWIIRADGVPQFVTAFPSR